MNPTTIIHRAMADGVRLSLSPNGNINATGDSAAVNHWLESIRENKAAILEVLKRASDPTPTSRRWLTHFADRDPMDVACCPDATHAEILQRYPAALAAEPLTPRIRQPTTTLSVQEERDIRAWLTLIKETDSEIIAEITQQRQSNADAKGYFKGRAAAKLPKPAPLPDDRRTCKQCANLSAGVCSAAKRGEMMASPDYQPAPDQLRRCEAYRPGRGDPDPRRGGERWPGLIIKVED